jgi:hypothetical protein
MPRCTPRLIYMKHTTWCAFEKVMNGRWHLKPITTISNTLWCHLALPTCLLFSTFDERYLSWIFGWFHGLLHQWHPHFFKEHGRSQCHVCLVLEKLWEVGLYTNLDKCDSINLKWNYWVTSSLEMAFAWILIRFKPFIIRIHSLYD